MLVAWNAGLRERKRCRHCCWMMVGPPANCRAKTTAMLALASRQLLVTNGPARPKCGENEMLDRGRWEDNGAWQRSTSGTHATWRGSLLLGPEGSPEQAGGLLVGVVGGC